MQLIALLVMALTPDWVRHGGVSPRFPTGSHLLGFAVVEKPDQLDQAKQAAAADLASRITVRIENQMSDVNEEKDGKQSYAVATMTKASTDVRLSGLSYETHVADGKTYALAILDRQAAAGEYRTQRNLAIQRAE